MKPGGIFLASQCLNTFEEGHLIPKLYHNLVLARLYWLSQMKFAEGLQHQMIQQKIAERSLVQNRSNLIHQMLYLHYDFNEALSNTTRETIKSVLKQKSAYKSENRKKKIFNFKSLSKLLLEMMRDKLQNNNLVLKYRLEFYGSEQAKTKKKTWMIIHGLQKKFLIPSSFLQISIHHRRVLNKNAESDAEGLDGDEQMSASDYEKLRQRYNNRFFS
ncbi:hypothetical protein RIR_jg38056.t4 [Rhizophagus irregularis DAOM 181602=DAOM 197198]|nr:hypothetical protein RIR_jg38056.t4 [Rhizophagus irregularis DAOM 181602=DAOM 197198]